MAVVSLSGKQFTLDMGGEDYSAQIRSGSIERKGSSETIQTWGDSLTVSKGVEDAVKCDFLYDGATGFYEALWSAAGTGAAVPVTIVGGTGQWAGELIVESVSDEAPADGASTCSADLKGPLTFGPAGTPGTVTLDDSAKATK
jgi:hypothetical protein